jgi:hypothetical protein
MDLPVFLEELSRREVAFEMHVAGTGPAEPELRRLLARWIADGSVRMHGWVSQAELYENLYPESDCFVHFAAWEGMTIAPREAMAHGVVPVISRFPGLRLERQFVEGQTALTFEVADVRGAADCVERLSLEPGLLAGLSARAAQSQGGRRSFDGAMDAWAQALDHCLQMPACRGPLPAIPSRSRGRLSRWGIPGHLQDRIRDLLRRKVRHRSPGSEWPTSSGLAETGASDELRILAQELDSDVVTN